MWRVLFSVARNKPIPRGLRWRLSFKPVTRRLPGLWNFSAVACSLLLGGTKSSGPGSGLQGWEMSEHSREGKLPKGI